MAKIKDIINMNRYDLAQKSARQLRPLYNKLQRELNKRIASFEKHGKGEAIPKRLKGIETPYGKQELLKTISGISNWMLGKQSTYKGYVGIEKQRKKELEERLSYGKGEGFKGYKVKLTDAEFEDYKRFMGEMQTRASQMWARASDDAQDLYAQAKRLNLNPKQFLRNYDYWIEHVDDLKEATPINKNNLHPSDYAKQLNLPKIRGGGKYGD